MDTHVLSLHFSEFILAYMLNPMFYIGPTYTPIFVIQSKSEWESFFLINILLGQKIFFFPIAQGHLLLLYCVHFSNVKQLIWAPKGGYVQGLESADCLPDALFLAFVKSPPSRCPEGSRERREDLGEAARGKETFLDLEGKRNQHVPENSYTLKTGCENMRSD